MTYIGIDPGWSGGIAQTDGKRVSLFPMPQTERDIWELLKALRDTARDGMFIIIEQVQGYIGGRFNPGATMFKFGHNYGALRMCLTGLDMPFQAVTPAVWEKRIGAPLTKKGQKKEDHKRDLKTFAIQLFPKVQRVTLDTCDALLLMEYARRIHRGKV